MSILTNQLNYVTRSITFISGEGEKNEASDKDRESSEA